MLKDKIVVVTGAASGIGLAVAESFAQDGAKVLMVDVQEEKLKEESERIGAAYVKADLTKQEDCKRAIEKAAEEFGGVDILVNIAGVQTVSPIADFPEDKWKFIIDLMLTAPFLLSKYAWPYMQEKGWGRIINLNSIHGMVASEFKSAYVSAKHGLTGLTKVAALEGAKDGITCNSICPAYVRTPLVDKQIADQAKTHNIPEEEVISQIMLQKAAIKRLLEPSEVAEVCKFLCSDAAKSITGIVLPIDGGWTAG